MKFRLLDVISSYTPTHGIAVRHAVSFEEILSARRFGGMEVPRTFLLALAQEAAGFFYAAESDFRFWAQIGEIEHLSFDLYGVRDAWQIELVEIGNGRMKCSGTARGILNFEKMELALLYDPKERRAMFHALRRENGWVPEN